MVPFKRIFTWISGLGLAILPKCPICYVTYSSSAVICGLSTPSESKFNIPIILILTILTIVFLVINYRGKRTLLAILMVAAGVLLFVLQDPNLQSGNPMYYLGSLAILTGVIINKRKLTIRSKADRTHDQENCVGCMRSIELTK